MSTLSAGVFVAVVGPSGAGKDTLLRLASEALREDGRFHFVRRLVTRSSDPGIEDHDTLSPEDYEAARATGRFSLHWRAHGLAYALPGTVDEAVRNGVIVVANISRGVLLEAAERYPRLLVVNIDAPEEVRRARIAARGREQGEEGVARVSRRMGLPEGLRVVTVMNDGRPEEAAAKLTAILTGAIAPSPSRGATQSPVR